LARSIDFYFQTIVDAVAADPVLSTKLTSTSKVSVWRLFAYVVATAIWSYEKVLDQAKAFIQMLVDNRAVGTPEWIIQETYKFQYGDILQVINGIATYPDTVSDAALAKRIIKRAAFSEEDLGIFVLKVAKEDSTGKAIPLSAPELAALIAYWQKKKYPGINFEVRSLYPDKIRASVTVYKDEQIPDAQLTPLINAAVQNYIVSKIPFNGKFLTNKFIDAIQQVENVEDIAVIGTLQVAYNNGSSEDDYSSFQPINRAWLAKSGYFMIEQLNITYLDSSAP
jgi:hypothetical protein